MPKEAQIFEPELLEAFLAVVDTGSFTEAARMLGRSQSTVSAAIRRLEESVGQRIFNRTTRSVLLTASGEEMVRYARRISEITLQARRRFSQPSCAGAVRLGIFTNFDSPVLPVALRKFNQKFPDVQVTIYLDRSDVLLSRLQEGTLDVALAVRQQGHGFGSPLWQDELVWVGSREIPRQRQVPVPLATLAKPSMLRRIAVDALNGAGRSHLIAFESNSFVSVASAISAGMAIGVFPRHLRPLDIPIVDPKALLPTLGTLDFVLLKSPHDQRPEVVGLMEILRGQSPDLLESAALTMFGRTAPAPAFRNDAQNATTHLGSSAI